MSLKKSFFQQICLLALVVMLSALFVTQAEAVTFTVEGKDCKDMRNDGIQFVAPVSITGTDVEIWRDRIKVIVTDPADVDYHTVGTDNIMEVVLYPASSNTPYQCQQLTTDGHDNSFSCNSFPSGATIGRVSVRFIPRFTAPAPGRLIDGTYKISVRNLNTPSPFTEILGGTAKVDAYSSACAWNQNPAGFRPDTARGTNEFVYRTCDTSPALQTLFFLENPANPFTIVSFPLGEAVVPGRFKVIASPILSEMNYTIDFFFDDRDPDDNPNPSLTIRYDYIAATKTGTITVPVAWGAVLGRLPIKLLGGNLALSRAVTQSLLPEKIDYEFTLYYENIDPSLGVDNSLFHFTRSLSVLNSRHCPTDVNDMRYRISPLALDPCVTGKQVFDISFINTTTGIGYRLDTGTIACSATPDTIPFSADNFANTPLRHMYFFTQRCSNANCTTLENTDAYVYRAYVNDAEMDNRHWHYSGVTGSTITDIHMRVFQSVARPFRVNRLLFTASRAGTYRIRAFIPNNLDGAIQNRCWMDFYYTIPEKSGNETCRSSGADGIFIAPWDGCKEDHDPQTSEFKVSKEHYGFVSNYSNQKLIFKFNPAISTIPMAANITELYCDWQVLADGYGTGGAVCAPDRIELPPMTRAIVKGGKIHFTQRPKISDKGDVYEYVLAYQRTASADNMNLLIDVQYKPCPQEKIPETGYSLRSPQPMSPAAANEFIFTGNKIQIPAIGLGMEYPIPIVHVYYKDGDLANGWDLSMLGGYIGELEGGAYIPYGGNAVLTGHYYSQGVFVNLVNLHLEDEIIVYATDGMKYIYKVTNSFWTKPNDMYTMFQPNGEKSLTLVTCDNYNFINDEYEKRYIVQATLESSEPYQH